MPRRAIEMHDSVIAEVSFPESEVQLYFSVAYIHQSDGVPGRDAGSVWVQRARLHIHHADFKRAFRGCPVDLGGGQSQVGHAILENEIPVPLQHKGTFELRLEAMWDKKEVVIFRGSGAELELLGEPEYLEEFRP